ncbi:uncharacterized protein LOC112639570 isoform X1 [Camponotus floridanus]|uniref:uncharacterized protein LOC112639570 isoform X1 n=1 Tax=Camponotus floridanus TaxID=104421 RepID=UPI000DC67989|nr:uncharacterized protein LOC112639570 isoform X1 [Camponotus floridanus]
MHNLTSNMTYYFRVRVHTKIVAGPYTDLINVSTTHENSIPILLHITYDDIKIWDLDLNIINIVNFKIPVVSHILHSSRVYVTYLIQDHRIYWIDRNDLKTWKINENNITKIASFDNNLENLCIDWVARNLYFTYNDFIYSYIMKFDLTMWENGIIKFDEIIKSQNDILHLSVSPSMGMLYRLYGIKGYNNRRMTEYSMVKYHLDGEIEQSVKINTSLCLFSIDSFYDLKIDDMNNEELLIYRLSADYTG